MWFGASGGGGSSSGQRQQQQLPEIQQWPPQQSSSPGDARSRSSSNGSPSFQGQLDICSSQQQQYRSSSQQSMTGQQPSPTPTLTATAAALAANHHQLQQQSHHSSHGNSLSSSRQERISFHLKTSIFTRRVTIETDKMALGLIKQLAIAFLNDIYFEHQYPANSYIGDYIRKHFSSIDNQQSLYERLVLRKYNCQQGSFVPFNSVSDIEPESHISIEVNEKDLLPGGLPPCSVSVSPVTSVGSATATQTPSPITNASSTSGCVLSTSGGQLPPSILAATPTSHGSPAATTSAPAPASSGNSSSGNAGFHQHHTQSSACQLKIAHEFNIESFLRPTFCALCTALIKGVYRQGFQCIFCKKNFCKECKAKAEISGDVCLSPPSPSLHHHQHHHHHHHQQQHFQPSPAPEGGSNSHADTATTTTTAASSNHVNLASSPNSQATTNSSSSKNNNSKLDLAHSNMSKRKSASNLLHFSIANPFKSHHASAGSSSASGNSQQAGGVGAANNQASGLHQQAVKTKSRGSAGALDPVLQQLSKMREHQQQQALEPSSKPVQPTNSKQTKESTSGKSGGNPKNGSGDGNLMVMAQTAHLSSSHQNLFTSGARLETLRCSQEDYDQAKLVGGSGGGSSGAGSSSAHQSPIGSRHHGSQLSNSARTSASDLHASSSSSAAAAAAAAAAAPKPRDHSFICMDWIQVASGALCQVCNKPLRSSSLVRQQQQQFESKLLTPFKCKSCQLQVHGHCHRLVLADCTSRIAESSRAAAERKGSKTGGAGERAQNSSEAVGGDKAAAKSTNSNASRDNIPLHRLQTSVRHVKPPTSKPLIQGWLRHTTLADEQARRHYWRLDQQEITLYDSDTTTRYFKAIGVNKITRVMSANSLPKRVKEDVVLMATRARLAAANSNESGQQHQQQQSPSASTFNLGFSFPNSGGSPARRVQAAAGATGADNSSGNASANTSPIKSPELRAQMNAMFAFELSTGLMFLVQAGSELEACRWQEALASVLASQRPPPQPGSNGQQDQSRGSGAAVATRTLELASPRHSQAAAVGANEQQSRRQQEFWTPAANTDPSGAADVGPASCVQAKLESAALGAAGGGEAAIVSKLDACARNTTAAAPAATAPGATESAIVEHEKQQQQQADSKGQLPAAETAQIVATTTQILAAEPTEQAPRQPAVQRQQRHRYPPAQRHHRGQHKAHTDPNRSRLYNRPRITIELDPMSIPDHMIECKYLVERDRVKKVGFEELGSGQFGKVYAAISEWKREDTSKGLWSGVPVAIKEISKVRFDLRQQAKLKNEANILSHLDHPGVIILERVHDLPDKIYIVMEQLEDDMLEMIVSTEEKRLSERVTKFLTYQIIEALKYLHAQNIAHCDLKPENVLLVERRSQFPQIKLCDFGFAKIIEENSFRSSLVGTPAYLAPEVVKGERYNRSVDLWSVGVIVYVSLSGEFPFNEGENIHDQISRANFMYPDQPWAKISKEAKNFINSLLRVNCERRLLASQAQMDKWLQDYQLWCDLTELEVRVGKRWVTDDADYKNWSSYAAEHSLQVPRSAVQLHEELNAD